MSGYTVNFSGWNGFFPVPTDLVDRHLKLASPNAVKALLFILRNGSTNADSDSVSAALSIPKSEAEDALMFWVKAGIIAVSCENSDAAAVLNVKADAVVKGVTSDAQNKAETQPSAAAAASAVRPPHPPSYSSEDIGKAVEIHPELKYLFSAAEKAFAKPLSNSLISGLFRLYDWYGISVDVICMVMDRCLGRDRLSMSSIEKEALDWQKNGVVTATDADRYIIELEARNSMYSKVRTAFGLGQRELSANEKKMIDLWRREYGFGIEMITLAYNACIDNTAKISFNYINKVLLRWHEEKLTTPELVAENAKKYRSDKKQKPGKQSEKKQTSYDLSDEARKAFSRFDGGDD